MCHYKKGNKNEITLVFSCPGQEEEKQGEPAAGQTGKNLDMLLKLLNNSLNYIGSFTRKDITITNSTTKVEYKALTGRSEATPAEVLNEENIQRLYDEIKNTKKLIICFGDNAKLGVNKVLDKYGDINAEPIYVKHIGMQGINSTISIDINGNKIMPKNPNNTKKRLEVIGMKIKEQIKRRFSEDELYNLCLAKFIIMENESSDFYLEEIILYCDDLLEKYESMEQNNRDELEEKLYSVADKFKEELKEIKASSERDNIDELTSKIVKELNKYYNK